MIVLSDRAKACRKAYHQAQKHRLAVLVFHQANGGFVVINDEDLAGESQPENWRLVDVFEAGE